jgi:hypothetical protein
MLRTQIAILFLYFFIFAQFIAPVPTVTGQGVAEQSAKDRFAETLITIWPATEPVPALRYRLLPEYIDMRPGNAAVFYGKVKAQQNKFFNDQEIWVEITALQSGPLDQIPTSETAKRIATNESFYKYMRDAALCETCDWQVPIRTEPAFDILLPELQETRIFARLLVVRIRWQIANGEYDQAIESLQTGFALARNNASGPSLIHALVGNAIHNMMADQLLELVQQPKAPSLYWALTSLPDPSLDTRIGLEVEKANVLLGFPFLRDVGSPNHSVAFWNQSLMSLWNVFERNSWEATRPNSDPRIDNSDWTLTLAAMRGYTRAKNRLLQEGWAVEALDSLPVAQVILIADVKNYERARDQVLRLEYLPYLEAEKWVAPTNLNAIGFEYDETIPFSSDTIPALQTFSSTRVRAARSLAVLRVVDALRLHTASNDGRLPGDLGQITIVPVPNDPVTGLPFSYIREDFDAVLQGPAMPGEPLKLRIRMGQ